MNSWILPYKNARDSTAFWWIAVQWTRRFHSGKRQPVVSQAKSNLYVVSYAASQGNWFWPEISESFFTLFNPSLFFSGKKLLIPLICLHPVLEKLLSFRLLQNRFGMSKFSPFTAVWIIVEWLQVPDHKNLSSSAIWLAATSRAWYSVQNKKPVDPVIWSNKDLESRNLPLP